MRSHDLLRLEQVVELYRGDLLDGHDEPWVRTEQERLAQRYLEALAALVDLAKRLGATTAPWSARDGSPTRTRCGRTPTGR